ncbi:MAG: protein translocase subunit SecF, partial [Legionellales bacterium]|nr:protein translocase subunit SecF [Legionellales bacterium]
MEFFKKNTKIDFLKTRNITASISAILMVFAIFTLSTKGLNWGLDFTGGTQIEIAYEKSADLQDIRRNLSEGGYEQVVVQNYGTSRDVLINIPPIAKLEQATLVKKVLEVLPGATAQRVEFIGPQVGDELMS